MRLRSRRLFVATTLFMYICVFWHQPSYAQNLLNLPEPGTLVSLSRSFEPVIIKGLTVDQNDPFKFDFIVDKGQAPLTDDVLKREGEKLIKYFLASLAIPEKDVWVNLSPYEKDRTVPHTLGQTDMGRDLLAQDYLLKQITASLIYPEKALGKAFWNKVYAKAQESYGSAQVPVNTFNKVWIMADRAEVFEHGQTAFVIGRHLKVMLEEDYLASHKHAAATPVRTGTASLIIKQIILPEIEREVNTGENFANLRQIFNSLILAAWYKKRLKGALLNQVYANQEKVKGIHIQDPAINDKIYERYLQAYKKGVFNFIKEDTDVRTGAVTPRKYFSGGVNPHVEKNLTITRDLAMATDITGQNRADKARWIKFNVQALPGFGKLAAKSVRAIAGSGSQFSGDLKEGPDSAMMSEQVGVSGVVSSIAGGHVLPEAEEPGVKMSVFEKEHFLKLVSTFNPRTGVLRMAKIFKIFLGPRDEQYLFDKIKSTPVLPLVLLNKETLRLAVDGDVNIRLNASMGKIPQGYIGKKVVLSKNATEILNTFEVRYPKRKFKRAKVGRGSLKDTRVRVRAGGFFRVKVWDDETDQDLFLLTFNHDDHKRGILRLTAVGGRYKFDGEEGKAIYAQSGIAMAPADKDPMEMNQYIQAKDVVKFRKLFRQGHHDPIERELSEELLDELSLYDQLPPIHPSKVFGRKTNGSTQVFNIDRLLDGLDVWNEIVAFHKSGHQSFDEQRQGQVISIAKTGNWENVGAALRESLESADNNALVKVSLQIDDRSHENWLDRKIVHIIGVFPAAALKGYTIQEVYDRHWRQKGDYLHREYYSFPDLAKPVLYQSALTLNLGEANGRGFMRPFLQNLEARIRQKFLGYLLVGMTMNPSMKKFYALFPSSEDSDDVQMANALIDHIELPEEQSVEGQERQWRLVTAQAPAVTKTDAAMSGGENQSSAAKGGIDLNAQNMELSTRQDGAGVRMNVDAAILERIKREGIESLTPQVLSITPVTSIFPLLGMTFRPEEKIT